LATAAPVSGWPGTLVVLSMFASTQVGHSHEAVLDRPTQGCEILRRQYLCENRRLST
jgi:hypothetical protein